MCSTQTGMFVFRLTVQRKVPQMAPHQVPASFAIRLFLLSILAALRDRCSLYERVWSKETPRYTGYW